MRRHPVLFPFRLPDGPNSRLIEEEMTSKPSSGKRPCGQNSLYVWVERAEDAAAELLPSISRRNRRRAKSMSGEGTNKD
jgi:hypothetical protein